MQEVVKYMRIKQAIFSFKGRIGRLECLGYGLLLGFSGGLVLVFSVIMFLVAKQRGSGIGEVCGLILILASICVVGWTSTALQVKRLHDMDMSGYYLLALFFIGLVIAAFGVVYPSTHYVEHAANLATLLIFCLFPGTSARNRYDVDYGARFSTHATFDGNAAAFTPRPGIKKPVLAWVAIFAALALVFAATRPFLFHNKFPPADNVMNVPGISVTGDAPDTHHPQTEISGAWTGQYICRQGTTALDLQIANVDHEHLTALFYFHAVTNGSFESMFVPEGCFLMQGVYDPARRTVTLTPANWIDQPSGFVSVSLQGQLNNEVIAGQIIGPGCSTFILKRGDDSAGRPAPCKI